MDTSVIESWGAEKLILEVFNELREASSTSDGLIHVIQSHHRQLSDEKLKEILDALQSRIETICELREWMNIWIRSHGTRDIP